MKDWPRLSVASLKAIERAERKAKSSLGNSIRPYTPGDISYRRTTDNLREGGYRSVDYICAYAETIFDVNAREYAKRPVEIKISRDVLTQRVAAEVERKARKAWGAWLFSASVLGPPKVSGRATLPGDIRIDTPPEHAKLGFETAIIRLAEKPSDPKLGPIMLQLQERFETQIGNLLQARIQDWENRWPTREKPALIEKSSPRESEGKRKRGRPQTISDEKKEEAARMKASGATNKVIAAKLYDTKYPTSSNVKCVPSILRHFQRKSNQSPSASTPREASPKPRKIRG
jgi:hypothetical protein